MQLWPVLAWERHESEQVCLGLIHESGEFGKPWAQLIGDVAPSFRRRLSGFVGEDGTDCGNHTVLWAHGPEHCA